MQTELAAQRYSTAPPKDDAEDKRLRLS